MTPAQRSQVARLLRNAAEHGGISVAFDAMLGVEPDAHRLAVEARRAVRMYETRPSACREFTPGGKSCREYRQELGL